MIYFEDRENEMIFLFACDRRRRQTEATGGDDRRQTTDGGDRRRRQATDDRRQAEAAGVFDKKNRLNLSRTVEMFVIKP